MRLATDAGARARTTTSPLLWATLGCAALAGACGADPEPRYGRVSVSSASPSASLTGRTTPSAAAIELAPGCPGFVDPGTPDHVLVITEPGKLGLTARSEEGPLTLVVGTGDAFRCDTDDGTGHAPHVQILESGRYAVWVGSLASTAPLAYELAVGPDSKDDHGAGPAIAQAVNASITSSPAGATVRTPDGQVVGTTPAILVLPNARPGDGSQHVFLLELEGYRQATLHGLATGPELVLHAELASAGPRTLTATANTSQPIRDFSTATQSVELTEGCRISDVELDVDVRHSYVGDLIVSLRSPQGTNVTLSRFRGGARSNLRQTYRMSDTRALRPLAGEEAQGRWELSVRDQAELDVGSFDSFTLRATCAPPGSAAAAPAPSGSTGIPRPSGGASGHAQLLRHPLQRTSRPALSAASGRPIVLDPWGD